MWGPVSRCSLAEYHPAEPHPQGPIMVTPVYLPIEMPASPILRIRGSLKYLVVTTYVLLVTVSLVLNNFLL